MTKADKRRFDLGLLVFGFLLVVALLNVDRLTVGHRAWWRSASSAG
ncbi:MAG TPA: hypothetical protein VK726_20880 [Acetobacteraceae bacterium]|nr:hypothetical protein [Acetobacteraceae bacterium]